MTSKDPPQTAEEREARRKAAIRELNAEWDRKLEGLNRPDAHERIEAMFEARGRTKKRPKAGETY